MRSCIIISLTFPFVVGMEKMTTTMVPRDITLYVCLLSSILKAKMISTMASGILSLSPWSFSSKMMKKMTTIASGVLFFISAGLPSIVETKRTSGVSGLYRWPLSPFLFDSNDKGNYYNDVWVCFLIFLETTPMKKMMMTAMVPREPSNPYIFLFAFLQWNRR